MTQEEFIKKSKQKFQDLFSYEKLNYIDHKTEIALICKEHGEFITTPTLHLYSKLGGCKKCRKAYNKWTQEKFIKKCKEIYKDFFTYNKTQYINCDKKVIVTCPIHGDFLTRPSDFIRGHSCPRCKGEKLKINNKKLFASNKEEFVLKGELKYPGLFNYDKVIYINNRIKVLIYSNICKEYFYITPAHFLQKNIKNKYLGVSSNLIIECKTNEAFLQEARLIHGNKYNYDKCKYHSAKEKVVITCPKHGDFLIMPGDHITHRSGCPKCQQSKGENLIDVFLQDRNLNYQRLYPIIIGEHTYKIDFCLFINRQKIFIEYNGELHYKAVSLFGGEEGFQKLQNRDKLIFNYCSENQIPLLVYKYDLSFYALEEALKNDLLNYAT